MKLYRITLAVLVAGLSTVATAKDGRGARCWINEGYPGLRQFETAALSVDKPGLDDYAAETAMAVDIKAVLAAYVTSAYGISVRPQAVGCHVLPSLEAAAAEIDGITRGSDVVFTSWTPGKVPRKAAAPMARGAGTGLTISEKDTTAVDLTADRVATDLQAQKESAAINAKRIADAARNDAAMKIKVAKFMEELKKRGAAQ